MTPDLFATPDPPRPPGAIDWLALAVGFRSYAAEMHVAGRGADAGYAEQHARWAEQFHRAQGRAVAGKGQLAGARCPLGTVDAA